MDTTTKTITLNANNGVVLFNVPPEAPALSARKLELDQLPDPDPETIAEQYLCLADEFEDIGYVTVAGSCRRRAAYWRK